MKHPDVLGSMFQLRSKKDCVKDLIEGLKAAGEAQKKHTLTSYLKKKRALKIK